MRKWKDECLLEKVEEKNHSVKQKPYWVKATMQSSYFYRWFVIFFFTGEKINKYSLLLSLSPLLHFFFFKDIKKYPVFFGSERDSRTWCTMYYNIVFLCSQFSVCQFLVFTKMKIVISPLFLYYLRNLFSILAFCFSWSHLLALSPLSLADFDANTLIFFASTFPNSWASLIIHRSSHFRWIIIIIKKKSVWKR